MKDFIKAFIIIFVAEMGDKSQIIAMTFATKFTIKQVISGVALGVVINHGLAIILGKFISNVIPLFYIQILAGLMFLVFGLMSLTDEELEEEGSNRQLNPIVTVALAFFLSELGDKTQLAALALASESSYPIFILCGTTLGMVATSGLGIFVGSKIGHKIPELGIKIFSSLSFVILGSIKILTILASDYMNMWAMAIYILVIFIIESTLILKLVKASRGKRESLLKETAERLHRQSNILKKSLECICLSENKCGKCMGPDCLIGYTKFILKEAIESGNYFENVSVNLNTLIKKEYQIELVVQALSMLVAEAVENDLSNNKDSVIHKIKNALELIAFEDNFPENISRETYIARAKDRNISNGMLLEKDIQIYIDGKVNV